MRLKADSAPGGLRRVYSGEWRIIIPAFVLAFANFAAFISADTFSDTLFLTSYPREWLPWQFILNSLFLAIGSICYSLFLNKTSLHRANLSTLVLLLCGFSAGSVCIWLQLKVPILLISVCAYVMVALQSVVVWNLLGSCFDSRQAKRLLPLVMAGCSMGTMAGGLAVPWIVSYAGLEHILEWILFHMWVVCLGTWWLQLQLPQTSQLETKTQANSWQHLGQLFRTPLVRQLLLLASLSVVFMTCLDYQFKSTVQQHFNRDGMGAFISTFLMLAEGASLLLQLVFVQWVTSRWGLGTTLLLLPLLTGLGAGLALRWQRFEMVAATRFIDLALRNSFQRIGEELLISPMPRHVSQQLKSLIQGFFVPCSVIGCSIGLLLMQQYLPIDIYAMGWILLLLLLPWIVLAISASRHYLKHLTSSITTHRLVLANLPTLSNALVGDSRPVLLRTLKNTTEPSEIAFILDLVVHSEEREDLMLFESLLQEPRVEIRLHTLQALQKVAHDQHVPLLAKLLAVESDFGVIAAALGALATAKEPPVHTMLPTYLHHHQPMIQLQAALCLVRNPNSPFMQECLALLRQFSQHPDTSLRIALATSLAFHRSAYAVEGLLQLLRDRNLAVQKAAVMSAGQRQEHILLRPLLSLLAEGYAYPELRQALSHYQEQFLSQWDPSKPITVGHLFVLGSIATPAAVAILVTYCQHSERLLRYAAVRALRRAVNLHGQQLSAETLLPVVRSEMQHLKHLNRLLAHFQVAPHRYQFIYQELILLLEQCCRRLFDLLAICYHSHTILNISLHYFSPEPEKRANALELLESQVRKDELIELVQLLEQRPGNPHFSDVVEPLWYQRAELLVLADEDPWLRTCFYYLSRNLSDVNLPDLAAFEMTFYQLDKIILLRPVALFTYLSAQELRDVADVAYTVAFPSDAVVFFEEEPGDYFYIIVAGEVRVMIKGVEITRLKQGQGFGEIALLDDTPRTATIVSQGNLECLRIGYTDFQRLLDENPAIARGVNRQMANYTRQLMAQLEAAKTER